MLENGEEYIGEYHIVGGGGAFVGPAPKTTVRPIRLRSYYTVHDQFVYDRLHRFQVPVKLNSQPQPYIYIPNESEGVYVDAFLVPGRGHALVVGILETLVFGELLNERHEVGFKGGHVKVIVCCNQAKAVAQVVKVGLLGYGHLHLVG